MQKYNIFNLAVITLHTNNRKYQKYFDNEFMRMKSPDASTSTPIFINITIGKLPEKRSSDIHRKSKFKNLFTYEYIVRNVDGQITEIYFSKHFIDKVYINAVGVYLQAQVLEPIMYYKLLKREVLLIHAAGVERDGKGFLMPAYGGTGKTTLALRLLDNGFRLLGDDLLLVDIRSKVVYAYPRPFHLFSYNINSIGNARIPLDVSLAVRLKNLIRGILEKVTKDKFLISTRVHADKIYKKDIWSTVVPYTKIIYLKTTGKHEEFEITDTASAESHAAKIVASSDLNKSLENNILSDRSLVKDFRKLELETTTNLLKDFKKITYINPRILTTSEMEYHFGD